MLADEHHGVDARVVEQVRPDGERLVAVEADNEAGPARVQHREGVAERCAPVEEHDIGPVQMAPQSLLNLFDRALVAGQHGLDHRGVVPRPRASGAELNAVDRAQLHVVTTCELADDLGEEVDVVEVGQQHSSDPVVTNLRCLAATAIGRERLENAALLERRCETLRVFRQRRFDIVGMRGTVEGEPGRLQERRCRQVGPPRSESAVGVSQLGRVGINQELRSRPLANVRGDDVAIEARLLGKLGESGRDVAGQSSPLLDLSVLEQRANHSDTRGSANASRYPRGTEQPFSNPTGRGSTSQRDRSPFSQRAGGRLRFHGGRHGPT